MTNPGNIVRIRSRNGGHASVYEANMWAQKWSQGLFSGNGALQNTSPDMNVLVGGSPSKPDVIIGQNPSGYKVALDIIGQQLILLTTPASNSRISCIVAYTDDLTLQSTDPATSGSPSSCGLIVVNGTSAASPSPPTDSQIRAAITADGATGSQAVYGIVASIVVTSSTTSLTNTLIGLSRSTLSYDATSAPVSFSAYQASDQVISASAFTKLTMPLKEFDSDNVFDTVLHRFTAIASGLHTMIGSASLANMGDTNRMFVTLYKNGLEFRRGSRSHASTFDTVTTNIVTLMNLLVGDYVELYIWQNSGGGKSTISGPVQTFFQGKRDR